MGFAERAIIACENAFKLGSASERHIRDVLKSVEDGVFAVKWLQSDDVMVRRMAARIVSEKGPIDELIKFVPTEKDRSLLIVMLGMLGKPGIDVSSLSDFLTSDDMVVRDAAITMFCKTGQKDFLFPMIFSEDEAVSKRTKRLMSVVE